jgi:hypothetical protein
MSRFSMNAPEEIYTCRNVGSIPGRKRFVSRNRSRMRGPLSKTDHGWIFSGLGAATE